MNLRRLHVGELDQFIEMLEDAATWMQQRGIVQWTPGSMAEQRRAFEKAQARGELFVMASADRLYGGVALTKHVDPIWTDQPVVNACYLNKLVVAVDSRGQHVGEAMLAACEEMARAEGCEFIRLDCVAS